MHKHVKSGWMVVYHRLGLVVVVVQFQLVCTFQTRRGKARKRIRLSFRVNIMMKDENCDCKTMQGMLNWGRRRRRREGGPRG